MRLASPSLWTPAGPRGSERVLVAWVFWALVRGVGSGFAVCVWSCASVSAGGAVRGGAGALLSLFF